LSKFRVVLNAWLLALILFCIVAVPIFAAYSDCAYYITVTVSNNSSTSYPNLRVVYDVNPASLVAGGYMQVDADDVYLMNESTGLSSTALNMTGDGVHWLGVVNAPAHSNQQLRLYTGWVAAAGRNQTWCANSGDMGTVADSASLGIATNLTIEALINSTNTTGTSNIFSRTSSYWLDIVNGSYSFGFTNSTTSVIKDSTSAGGSGLGSGIYGMDWQSANFTATSSYWSTGVSLYFRSKTGAPAGNFDVSLRLTSSGKPSGSNLVYGSILANSVTGSSWATVTWQVPYYIASGTLYSIVASVPSGDGSNKLTWGYNAGTANYCTSTDSGSTWAYATIGATVAYRMYSGGVAYVTTPATTSVWQTVKGTYNGTRIAIYLNGVSQNVTGAVGTILDATSVACLEFDGLIDDLRVGSGSVVTPTWVATYLFEAAQANSGQIMDQSGNGNTITYTLAGMPSGTGTAVGSLTPITLYISTSVGGNTSASEPQVIPPFNIPLYENTTATGSNLLGYDLFVRGANSLGWSSATLYSVMFMEAAIAFGFAATIGTGTLFFGALAGMGLLTLGAATGLLAWWIPLILGLLIFMSITVFKEL